MQRSCAICATPVERTDGSLPLGWSASTSPRGEAWLCPACTREHARDIEAKLDEAWWS